MRTYLEAWRRRSRGARIADLALGTTMLVLAIALVVNAVADVHVTKRMQVDQRVMATYLVDYAGGPSQFGTQAYVAVHHGHDLVCAFLRHGNGGLCLKVASTSRKITREYSCINLPPWPKHVKHWKPPPPPRGQHWCPPHDKKIT